MNCYVGRLLSTTHVNTYGQAVHTRPCYAWLAVSVLLTPQAVKPPVRPAGLWAPEGSSLPPRHYSNTAHDSTAQQTHDMGASMSCKCQTRCADLAEAKQCCAYAAASSWLLSTHSLGIQCAPQRQLCAPWGSSFVLNLVCHSRSKPAAAAAAVVSLKCCSPDQQHLQHRAQVCRVHQSPAGPQLHCLQPLQLCEQLCAACLRHTA